MNPYSPTDTSNDSAANAGSEIASITDSETGNRGSRCASAAFAFLLLSGLSFGSASAINGVSCPLGFELMGDLLVHTRAAMDAAELPLFVVMNVMYSLLQLPPTVLFGVFALLLLFVKGHLVVPSFLGSITGYALRTVVDFGPSASHWLVLTFLEMGLIGLLFWHVRKQIGTRIHYPALNILGTTAYVCIFAIAAAYCLVVDF